MKDKNNSWTATNQASGVDASCYTGQVYDFMNNRLNRNSYNDSASFMECCVEHPAKHNNAGFMGSYMLIGDVDVDSLRSFAGNPDVIAHEWAHGITNSESNLVYEKESGALSEAFSNIMAAYFNYDWLGQHNDDCWYIGKNHWIHDSLRVLINMKEPHLTGQPDTYLSDNLWRNLTGCIPDTTPVNDHCYVHTNCGVPQKMFYLLSNGGTHNGISVQGIGIENAFKVIYTCDTAQWDSLTTFCLAKNHSIDAAMIIDQTGQWAASSAEAWNAVGVCPYVVGDANCNRESRGSDVTLIVAVIKGTATAPPDCKCSKLPQYSAFWMSADYNADCQISGADVTYATRYFKGLGNPPVPCSYFPPTGN